MTKRTAPLLYIYQPKEYVTEADNQEFFYAKNIQIRKREQTNIDEKKEDQKDPINEQTEEKMDEINEENNVKEIDILEKLTQIQSYSAFFEPTIEVKIGEKIYEGVLEKIEKGTIVLKTQEAPFTVTCFINEIDSVSVISL